MTTASKTAVMSYWGRPPRSWSLKAAVFMFLATNRQVSAIWTSSGPGDIRGIQRIQIVRVRSPYSRSPICHCLDIRVRHPLPWIDRRHRHSRDRWSDRTALVRTRHAELAEKDVAVIIGARSAKSLPAIGRQIIDCGVGYQLSIEANDAGLTALLSESGQILERHGPSRILHPIQVATGTPVNVKTWRNLDLYDRQLVAGACTQPEPFDNNVHDRRIDRLRARCTDQFGYGIQALNGNPCDVARVPVDAQDEHSAKAVREGRECVGKPIAVRCLYRSSSKPDIGKIQKSAFAHSYVVQ